MCIFERILFVLVALITSILGLYIIATVIYKPDQYINLGIFVSTILTAGGTIALAIAAFRAMGEWKKQFKKKST